MGVMNSDSHHDSYILTFMNKFPSHNFQVKFTHDPNLGTRSRPCLVVWSQVAEQSWVGVDWLEWRGGEDVIKISCAVDCGALMTAIGGKTRAPNGVKERLGGREGGRGQLTVLARSLESHPHGNLHLISLAKV